MTQDEIRVEFDYLKQKFQNDSADRAELNLKNLFALAQACMNENQHEIGLEVVDYCKPILEEMITSATGLSMRDTCDFLVAHPEYEDWRYILYWDFVKEETFDRFEPFMFFMERKRPFVKKFYEPRQYTKSGKPALKRVAEALEKLENRFYDFLGVSLPSRTGKSTICIFFLCWKALRHPNGHNAMGGHAGTLVKGFYKELLNLITSTEYAYEEIYERWHAGHILLRDKSAEDFTITLDEPDRFATLTCRGIDATWTGAIDVSKDGLLYVDDLVRDRQHSLSPTRMEETFQEYLNKMVDRKNDGAQELMVGTLWNVLDPLERLRKIYEGNPRYCFLRIPALDENDESDFDYEINGFSTEYYVTMRERLDNAEWQAKYQQQPFVREGLLFPTDELKYWDGLIAKKEIKSVFAITDPAFGGGDNLSMPVCIEPFHGKKKICRWVYDKRTLKFTIPRIIDATLELSIAENRLEKNGAGLMLENEIRKQFKERNVNFCKLISVSAPNRMSKEDKIKGYSDYIKDNFEFLAPNNGFVPDYDADLFLFFSRDADYNRAMDDMSMYTAEGKNVHDDAPDSMAQMAIRCEKKRNGEIEVLHIDGGLF